MDPTIEELKFVADLAHNGGMMKAQNEALSADLTKLQTELNEMKVHVMEMQVMMAAKDEEIAAKNRRIAELEAMVQQQNSQQPTMVVNQFFVLSINKTISYISALGNNERCFAGHFLHHTLTDGTPPMMLAKVDEITSLQGDVNRELADAIKEVANKPSTTINAANYNAHVDDQNNNFPELPPMAPSNALLADE